METPWLNTYTPRQWTLMRIGPESQEYRDLKTKVHESFTIMSAESLSARRHWKKHQSNDGVIYFDFEQLIGMDFDRVYGIAEIGVLTENWFGYPAGSLVMVTYKGAIDNPPAFTVGIAPAP